MLILTRKKDQSIVVNDSIEISIVEIEDGKVKIGINAPKEVSIHRKEVFDKIKSENQKATESNQNIDEFKKKLLKKIDLGK